MTSRSFINLKKIKKKEKRSCSNNSKKYESSKLNSSFQTEKIVAKKATFENEKTKKK